MANHAIPVRITFHVTPHTPAHGERRRLPQAVHGLDQSMAFLAGKALSDMGLVGKTHVPGEVVYPHPRHRLIFVPIGLEVLDLRLLGRGDLMAAHAHPDRGDPGDR